MTAYFFDTECTDRKDGEIIEAGFIGVMPLQDLAGPNDRINITAPGSLVHFTPLRFKPSKVMTTGAVAVHHILPHELTDCLPSSEFRLPIDCEYIVGHSIDFDWTAAGCPPVKRICTHAMAQWVYPEATGYSLVALIYMICGMTVETRALVRDAHNALADCQLATILLKDILKQRPDIDTWSQLHAFSEDCRIPRTCPMKKYEGVLLEDLDEGFIYWCLEQSWLDPYYRKGLERVMSKRYRETFA